MTSNTSTSHEVGLDTIDMSPEAPRDNFSEAPAFVLNPVREPEKKSRTPLNHSGMPDEDSPGAAEEVFQLPPGILLADAKWLCKLRWPVAAVLVSLGLLSASESFLGLTGLRFHSRQLIAIGSFLGALNFFYLSHLTKLARAGSSRAAKRHLRLQITADLLLLTWVIHLFGSLETYAPFAYLFHIVLACIVFTVRESFALTLLPFGLYLALLSLEASGLLSTDMGLFPDGAVRRALNEKAILVNLVSFLLIGVTIWYLASHLAKLLRDRDRELARNNEELLKSQTEKTRHMLRTTHELKAPFAAIHANTQLLINGYCGGISDEALAIVRRIAERAKRLSGAIQSMLQLANLTSVPIDSVRWNTLNLGDLLQRCIDQLKPVAGERGVTVEADLLRAIVYGAEDHLTMLFTNLVSNAILYSFRDGRIRVASSLPRNGYVTVIVEDHGIGIPAEKMPRIFDEYYRTEEAAIHNKDSTGLGLAIVKNVALAHRIRIEVRSQPGVGTRFTCLVPILKSKSGDAKAATLPQRIQSGIARLAGRLKRKA